jgi:hypothetical protein
LLSDALRSQRRRAPRGKTGALDGKNTIVMPSTVYVLRCPFAGDKEMAKMYQWGLLKVKSRADRGELPGLQQ